MNYEQPTMLLVKGANARPDYVSNLSRALSKAIDDFGYAEMQAVGPPAINNMVKAYIKSKNQLSMDNNDSRLVCQFAYHKPSIDDVIKTAIRTKVFPISSRIVMTPKTGSTILMVKGASSDSGYIKSLANAVIKSLDEFNYAEAQSIGPVAVSNSVKSYIKAKGIVSEYTNGLSLVMQFSFQKPEIDDKITTAIRANIFGIEDRYVI